MEYYLDHNGKKVRIDQDIAVRIDPESYVLAKNTAFKEQRTIKTTVKLAIAYYSRRKR